MYDAAIVRGLQGVEDSGAEAGDLGWRHRAAQRSSREALAVDELAHDVQAGLRVAAGVVNLDDALMADCRGQLGFLFKTTGPLGILCPPGLDDLDRHASVQ